VIEVRLPVGCRRLSNGVGRHILQNLFQYVIPVWGLLGTKSVLGGKVIGRVTIHDYLTRTITRTISRVIRYIVSVVLFILKFTN
jgi:hypothetical protein